jgi:tetratricopeptide (TPR) repeat protein/TolB-like protein
MIGQQIGRFRITAKLGEGGMGAVWKAEDPLLGRTVAIKILPEPLQQSPEACRRLLREARATSVLDHPGIATLYDAGEDAGRIYIASACIDGETVNDLIAHGTVSLREAVRIVSAAGDALEYAHAHGIVHRDVTASNIMIARDGRVIVIDFGLAIAANATSSGTSGYPVGTLSYIAPEVLKGQCASPCSDVYSLGVVLYELLTGAPPHAGELVPAVIYSILNEKPARPATLRPEIPAELDRVTLRALAKDPSKRYQGAAHFAQELRAVDLAPGATRTKTRAAPHRPVRGARLRSEGAAPRPSGTRTPPARKCIAIQAFKPLAAAGTPDGGDGSLAAGLAEALGSALARVPDLRVIPPVTTDSALQAGQDSAAAARAMGAGLLLKGTLSRAGETLRVDYAILDTRRGHQVGGDRVEGSLGEIMSFQDSLHTSLMRALQIGSASGAVFRADLRGAHAHEQYLRALGQLQRSDDESAVDRAITLLEELVVAEGDTAVVHAALGRACERKFRHSGRLEWIRKAEASCRTALLLDPHAPEVLNMLGRALNAAGRHADAVEALLHSLALRDEDPDALWDLSRAYEGLGRLGDAEHAARRIIAARPGHWKGYDRLGVLLFRRGRYQSSVDSWTRVIETTPDNANAHNNLGAAYFHLGRLDEAQRAYERAMAICPTYRSYSGLATVHFFTGKRRESISLLEKAVALKPRDPQVLGNLAEVQQWTDGEESHSAENFDRAIALAQGDLKRNPNDADRWSQMAKWLAKRNRAAEALAAIEKALRLAPENVSCVARSITVYHRAGQPRRAVESFIAAARAGYSLVELEGDPELESLRRIPEVGKALEESRAERASRDRPDRKQEADDESSLHGDMGPLRAER